MSTIKIKGTANGSYFDLDAVVDFEVRAGWIKVKSGPYYSGPAQYFQYDMASGYAIYSQDNINLVTGKVE